MFDYRQVGSAVAITATITWCGCMNRPGLDESWVPEDESSTGSGNPPVAPRTHDSTKSDAGVADSSVVPHDTRNAAPAADPVAAQAPPATAEPMAPPTDAGPSSRPETARADAGPLLQDGALPHDDRSGPPAHDAATTIVDRYDVPATCTSRKTWTGGNEESPLMRPGGECIACHTRDEGPRFAIAGTLYPTAHEPNDCNGTSPAGATIVIVGADGVEHSLTPNAAGNFFMSGAIARPYGAKVVYQGRTLEMVAPQTNGDCNTCHSQAGADGALGRLLLP